LYCPQNKLKDVRALVSQSQRYYPDSIATEIIPHKKWPRTFAQSRYTFSIHPILT
jgi:hypothetical protein